MLLEKRFEQKEINGVQMGNGLLSFRGVKLNVHSFFIDEVLIDTGPKSLESYFKPFFNQLNIEQVMITHYHEDHTGNASYLQNTLGVPLYMNQRMIESCKTKADYPFYRKFFWGKRKPFIANPIGDSFTSKRATWNVIKTPGHSRDHLSFLNNETGQLFTGDLFVNEKVKVILQEEHIPHTIESLQKILTYDFKEVFCNHAGHLSDGYDSLKTKLNHLTELQDRILHLYHEGRSPDEINQILFPRKYPITKLSLGEWDSLHIVESVINHEEKENAYQAR